MPSFVLVHDAAQAPHAKNLAASLTLPTVALPLDSGADLTVDSVIVDADLRDLASVNAIRQFLPKLPRERERIFLIDDGRPQRAARVQADALGATATMARSTAAKSLLRADVVPRLRRPQQPPRLPRTAQGRSIAIAGEQLAELFDGLLADRPVDLPSLTAASESILAGLEDGGASSWLATVRQHHEGTFQHCLLVAGTAAAYARHARLAKGPATALLNAALLHDVGKALIPLAILDKPGRLAEAEKQVVRRHPADGHAHLELQGDVPPVVLDAVRHHHELLDGSGYPDGLSGARIGPLTRILTVCDVFGALSEDRPYKPSYAPAAALGVLTQMAGSGKIDGRVLGQLADALDVELPSQDERPLDEPFRRR